MASKQTLNFKNINVTNFLAYIGNAKAGSFNHTFELTKDKVICKAFPQDKKFVKYTTVELVDILRFEQLPENFTDIKVPIYHLDKLNTSLDIFKELGIEDVSGTIDWYIDEESGIMAASAIEFKSKKTKAKVKATDANMYTYMDDGKFKELSNTDGHFLKFDIDKSFINKLQKLFKLDSMDAFIMKFDKENNSLIFEVKGVWSETYESNIESTLDSSSTGWVVPKEAIDRLNMPNYTVYAKLKDNGHTMLVWFHDENNMILNFVTKYDPNKDK